MTTTTSLDYLRAVGFKDANTEVPRRLIANIEGLEKTGKTRLALTAPPPCILFDIDIGTEGVIEPFAQTGKEILTYTIRIPKGAQQNTYETMWTDLKAKLALSWGLGRGTVIVDTGTEGNELARLSHFGKLSEVLPHHYGPVNSEWRELIRLAYDATDMNTIFTHKRKPKWVNNKRTDEYERSGFGEMGYMCQINILMHRDDSSSPPTFLAQVLDCRRNANLTGTMLQGPMLSFDFLLTAVHGAVKK